MISAYVAIRFEAKYAVPVLIALVHDILITAGIYALVGAEVSSATVAAFLTILGYSMYDTIIVFDRIRENVPRMPRAAFSQIVNRSMSEVLTRSLITGLSTVFLIGVLLIFGGDTLRDFALRDDGRGRLRDLLVDLHRLAGAHRVEGARAGLRSRRARIIEAMGRVPTFPEDNVVARIDEVERHVGEPPWPTASRQPAEAAPAAGCGPARGRRAAGRAPPARADARGGGRRRRRARRRPAPSAPSSRRLAQDEQSRRRRKHGRRR